MATLFTRRFISQIALVVGAVVFSAALQTQAVFTPPSTTPPNADAYAPLTTSPTMQAKVGGLILNSANAANGLLVRNGRVGIGTLSPSVKLDVVGEVKVGNSGTSCTSTKVGSIRYDPGSDVLQYCAAGGGTAAWKNVSVSAVPPISINLVGACLNPDPNGGGNNCPPSGKPGAVGSADHLCVLAGRSNSISITNNHVAGNLVGGAYWNVNRWSSTSWTGGDIAASALCQ